MSPPRPAPPPAERPPAAAWPCLSGGVGSPASVGTHPQPVRAQAAPVPPALSKHSAQHGAQHSAQPTRLQVAVTPGARRTGTDGLHDGALRVRLLAAPVDGKANAALVGWLAGELGLPQRAVRVVRGLTARRKQIEIDAPLGLVADWLKRSLGGPGPEAASATPQMPPTP